MAHTDLLLDDNNDLMIAAGDFVVGESAGQEARLLLLYPQGALRSDPLVGVGILGYINSELTTDTVKQLDKVIRQQFEMDDKQLDAVDYVVNDQQELLDLDISFEQNDTQ